MSNHIVPLANVMRLQQVLENGGTAQCQLRSPESVSDATVHARLEAETVHVEVTLAHTTGKLTLQSGDTAKYQHLRDFIHELANNKTDHVANAIALADAIEHVNTLLLPGQVAYITPTTNPTHPFGVVVANQAGEICAAVCGTNKEHLAYQLRRQLRPADEESGESE